MEYVAGQRMDVISPQLTLSDKVHIIREVALALHEAHKLGSVHRDLKPSNILIEPLASGGWQPVVMDFGLARQSDENYGITETGAVMGTPAYNASRAGPRRKVQRVDRRADVYSLDATLYELLSGKPPVTGPQVMDVLLAVIHQDPLPLRALTPQVPVDLETITLKCLSREPAQRYDSARALAEDLQRYVDGEPIVGRRASLFRRLQQRAKRNRALVGLSAAAGLMVMALLSAVVVSSLRARQGVMMAQQFGEAAKEFEAIMLRAYMMPLHDVQQERDLVAEQMDQLRAQMHGAGELADASGYYALARGYLATQDYERAEAHLQQAARAGLASAGMHYVYGRVLGERCSSRAAGSRSIMHPMPKPWRR